MKAHKYWSLGALACMAGYFYTGCKKLMQAHKYFACGSLVCMGMAIYPATKLHRRRKKLKSLKNKNTRPRRNKRGLFLNSRSSLYFRHKLYTSIISRIPTFRPSSKAVFSHAQHTVPCRSMIFSHSGILSPT